MVHICRQDRSVSQKQEILVRKLHILPTVNAAQTTVMEPEHAISTRRACFICRFYLVDLEPSGDTSCVVVMLARQRYHTFSVSETRQADRTAASKPKKKHQWCDGNSTTLSLTWNKNMAPSHLTCYSCTYIRNDAQVYMYFILFSKLVTEKANILFTVCLPGEKPWCLVLPCQQKGDELIR